MQTLRYIFLIAILVLVTGRTTLAQDGRINPSVLDIAIYCDNGGVAIFDVDSSGAGQFALSVTREQVGQGLVAANARGEVVLAQGGFGVTLWALPGLRLRAQQSMDDVNPYTYEFQGDTCGPLSLPDASTFNISNFASGVIVDNTASATTTDAATDGTTTTTDSTTAAAPVGTSQEVLYTIQRGDTLNVIARNFNITLNELVAANNLANPNIIYPGQQLIIPNQVVEAPAPASGENNPAPQTVESPTFSEEGTVSDNTSTSIAAAPAGTNLLRDSSFEGQYTGRGRADFNIPSEWGIQVFTSPRQYEWQNLVPYAFPHRAWVIRDGGASLNMNRGYATYRAVLYQQVSVPAGANLEASVWAWYHTCDAGSQNCSNASNPIVRVGIDPNGGTDAASGSIIWSGSSSPQGSWGLVGTSAQATGGAATMFIWASQDTPRAINELYLDEAIMRQVG
ncbi:MAG: LysM peptidoglycan-binding domain-containing protein [Chloroflexota bacterium]